MSRIENAALKLILSAIVIGAGIGAASAGPVGPLKTFSAGTPAKAADVNGNFTTIVNTVNTNDTRLTNVETTKQNIVTGACPAGSAIRAVAANGSVSCQNTGGSAGSVTVSAAIGIPENTTTATSLLFIPGGGIGRYASGGVSDFLTLPISLPNGATITSFSFTCLRNNAAAGCSGFLYRDDDTQMATTSIAAQAGTIQTSSTTTIASPVVDSQFAYIVFMSISSVGSTILPIRATVSYTLP